MFLFFLILNYNLMTTSLTIQSPIESSILESPKLRNLVEEYDCSKVETCERKNADCNSDYTKCTCYKGYTTSKEGKICGYEQKRQLTAFLLELFVGFGAGHFYRGAYLFASLKLVAFIFGIYIICLFPLTAKCVSDCCDCDCLVILVSIFFYLCACGLAFWFIFDLVQFGKNNYKDKNGYELFSWKSPD